MFRLQTIIIDDVQENIDVLISDLSNFPEIEVVATTNSSLEGEALVKEYAPDVLFMDVEMPNKTGIKLLQDLYASTALLNPYMKVVFYSAFDKYMLDAIRNSAFDFLLKPYKKEELEVIIKRIFANSKTKVDINASSLSSLFKDSGTYAVQTVFGISFIKPSDVVCATYNKDIKSWELLMTDKSIVKLKSKVSSKDILSLNDNFIQISQEAIVNADFLLSIENCTYECTLRPPYDYLKLVVSRRCFSKIRDFFNTL